MIVRSRAPLRLGLAGGGTDVKPYCDIYGGSVINATINIYAYCTISSRNDGMIRIKADDIKEEYYGVATSRLPIDNHLLLVKGVYNRIIKDYNNNVPLSLDIFTYSEVPAGSGLGTSSTMVVAIVNAFKKLLKLKLDDYDVARLAYVIERCDLGLRGGKQDQYAASFGGFNLIEFMAEDQVVVRPLKLSKTIVNELESSIVLFFTGVSRESATIIDEQTSNVVNRDQKSLEAMHLVKQGVSKMKEALVTDSISGFIDCINQSWTQKKKLAKTITNPHIERCYQYAIANGALAAKVSGAGGGGFMMILVDPKERYQFIKKMEELEGKVYTIHFNYIGSEVWSIK